MAMANYYYSDNSQNPPYSPEGVKKSPYHPHPGSPVEGEGISSCILRSLPSLLAGEGRVRGPLRNFFTPSPLPKGEIVIPLFGKWFDETHHPELVEGEGRGEIF